MHDQTDYRRKLGMCGEKLALSCLEQKGYRLLAKNYRCFLGEIDLVMKDQNRLVFIEVKTRSSERFGTALESVNQHKLRRIIRISEFFLQQELKGRWNGPVAIEVFAIQLNSDLEPSFSHHIVTGI